MVVHLGGRGPGHKARVSGAGGTFASIYGPDLVAWYDASDASTITHASGAVSQWRDKTANGYHVSQGTAGSKPRYSLVGLDGTNPSISFDGDDNLVSGTNAVTVGSSGFAAFYVGKISNLSASNARIVSFIGNGQSSDADNTSSVAFMLRSTTTANVAGFRNSLVRSSGAISYDTTVRVVSVWDGFNNRIYINGVASFLFGDDGGTLSNGTLYLGGAVFLYMTGHISEVAIVKAVPTDSQIAATDAMLASKWTAGAAGNSTFASVFGTDLVAWYDAQDANSIVQSSGSVSQWNDKSGSSYHLQQGVPTSRPTYSATGLGGSYPSLSFDGGDNLISGTDAVPMGVSSYAAFFVGRINSGSSSNGRVIAFQGSGQANEFNNDASGAFIIRSGSTQAVSEFRNSLERSVKAITYDTTVRVACVTDGANNIVYVNNSAGFTFGDGGTLAANGTLYIGGTGLSFILGHICEVALVKVQPSAGTLSTVDAMLAAKWPV